MAASDARPIPRKNTAFRVTFPLYDADGDLVTGAGSLDSEVSIDGGTFSDCTNEATEIATSSGVYYLDLTAGEMNGDTIAVIVKSAGAKTLPLVFYPEEAGDVRVDVVQISGDSTAADNAEAMFDGTGYAGGTAKLTVDVTKWLGTACATPTVAGVPEVDPTHWNGTAVATPATAGYPAVTLKVGTGTGEVNLASGKAPATIAAGDIANSAITAAAIAADAIGASELAADAVSEIQAAVAAGAVASVTGAVGSVTGAVGSVTGNVGGNVVGSVGSVVGAVGSVTGNVGGNVVGSVASVTAGVNATQINSSSTAAARLALAAAQMIPGTVDTAAHTPTTTVFEADDITEATADHYNGRLVLWTSGALVGQVTDVIDYALSSGRGRFTCTAMTEAPANNDTFILV